MKLIVGLGNPGPQYENTRHNVGFRVIDELSRRWQVPTDRQRFSGKVGGGWFQQVQVTLLKPTTLMNLSGRSVREAMTFYKLPLEDLLVVTDDMALPLARIRVRAKGSAGSHNGLASIVQELGDEDFARVRVGIGWVDGPRMVGHVLGAFAPEETAQVNEMIGRAANTVECWITEGIAAAMNKFNRADDKSEPRQ
jgi:peptidyl-tRNA hydrolase, PTH1 family